MSATEELSRSTFREAYHEYGAIICDGCDTEVDLTGWVTLNNQSGTAYRNADVVLVMEHGRLVEFGPPEELVSSRGRFAEMMEMSDF